MLTCNYQRFSLLFSYLTISLSLSRISSNGVRMLLLKVSAICTYISVVFSWLCPNSSFTIFKSVPCSIRCVANECRNRWGYTRLVIPASFAASFSFFDTMLSVNGSPLYRSKSHSCGLYSLVYSVSFLTRGFDSSV